MSKRAIKNLAGSIRNRLLNLSKEKKEDFAYLLEKFATLRFLYRLSESPYSDTFIIKGAYIFLIWSKELHRPTRDVDFLSLKEIGAEHIEQIFKEICDIKGNDGLEFRKDSVSSQIIREAQAYSGFRVIVIGSLENAMFRLQFDIGFGDTVTPEASLTEIPTLLNFPAPRLKVYPKESLISEKYEAMVKLGIANSRMKDFFDIWYISDKFSINGS